MSTVSLDFPPALLRQVEELARKDEISVDEFIATAVAEKLAALAAHDYLATRAARGSREKFLEVLSRVPNVEPDPEDRL